MLLIIIGTMLQIGTLILLLLHTERVGQTYERANTEIMERWLAEREAWTVERQQLLDRIQAPSFGELKHAEVKTIKAQQGIKDPIPLEPL